MVDLLADDFPGMMGFPVLIISLALDDSLGSYVDMYISFKMFSLFPSDFPGMLYFPVLMICLGCYISQS